MKFRRARNTPETTGAYTRKKRGQVLIEVLLILPVFMLLVFMIMEIGHLSFRTILLHHAAYEVARFGSLTALGVDPPKASCSNPRMNEAKMRSQVLVKILPGATMDTPQVLPTLKDPQELCPHYEVQVTLRQAVPMIFPMTGLVLGNARSRSARMLMASVRMPIERPLFR